MSSGSRFNKENKLFLSSVSFSPFKKSLTEEFQVDVEQHLRSIECRGYMISPFFIGATEYVRTL